MVAPRWVAVRPHGGAAFQAAQHAERAKGMVYREKARGQRGNVFVRLTSRDKEKKESEEGPATQELQLQFVGWL